MTPQAPVFSVVVPCYNAAPFIASALASIKAQTFRDFEVVVVNDGSTDESLRIIDGFPADFPLRVFSQENAGLGGARNRAIRESRGQYVTFLDADDEWDGNRLERVHAAIERQGADLICHDERFVRDGRVVRRMTYGPYRTYLDLLFNGNCLSPSAVSVRRDLLVRVGGFSEDRAIHGVEDYDLWMRLAREGATFYYLHELLGSYRLHDESMSSARSFDARELAVIQTHFASLDATSGAVRRGIRRRLGAYHAAAAYRMLRRHDVRPACREYVVALRHRPSMRVVLKYVVAGPILITLHSLRRLVSRSERGPAGA
jgi:teichuronic acid biosynthesis glycosyltransferase TuaG